MPPWCFAACEACFLLEPGLRTVFRGRTTTGFSGLSCKCLLSALCGPSWSPRQDSIYLCLPPSSLSLSLSMVSTWKKLHLHCGRKVTLHSGLCQGRKATGLGPSPQAASTFPSLICKGMEEFSAIVSVRPEGTELLSTGSLVE